MMLLLLVDTNFQHRLTDLHLTKLIMTVLTFRDVSNFSSLLWTKIKLQLLPSDYLAFKSGADATNMEETQEKDHWFLMTII